jgi:hypothetical protein
MIEIIKAGMLHQETDHQDVIVIEVPNSPHHGGVLVQVHQGGMIMMVQRSQEVMPVLEGTTGKGDKKRTQISVNGRVGWFSQRTLCVMALSHLAHADRKRTG